ncbi:MAG: cob(I)yrinic acid a,c-diamide adenosyltransferase [Butyricicoccus sp.]
MHQDIRSCIHIYYGNGKGKTSAGMGLCLRAAGHGMRVLIYQFLKGNTTGEIASLSHLPSVTRLDGLDRVKFSFLMSPEELQATGNTYNALFCSLSDMVRKYDLLFLDEAICAVSAGLLDETILIDFLTNRPPQLEVILTGHQPSARLLAMADYATRLEKVKHPFDLGQQARQGIEW